MGSIGSEEAMQALMDRQERIHVSVRVRPLNEKEVSRNDFSEWECINDNTIMHRSNIPASDRSLYPTTYTFDRVFRPGCSTRLVYEEAAKEVALSVVSGINSSIFAYGQTSSGKTYTMGGVIRFTVEDIYYYIQMHKEREFVLKFSAIEIYNESVKDLLSADGTPRRLLDDPERGTVVERLTEETLKDGGHFCELISFCDAQRQIGETSLNEFSSRSHQILRLTVESSAREFLGNDKSSSLAASVNFVDLAGSERASQTNSAGSRLKEATHINRSLLTLGTVIRKLSKGRNGHIPFRDSKLTRILQSSLGGNARTAIICTMSPARSHVEQTRNTLLFASCAKEVATSARVNVVVSDKALVKQLQRELARLENELRNSSLGCRQSASAALLREKDIQIEKLKKEVLELSLQRDQAQTRIRDMLQVVGNDLSAIESGNLHPQYPKLRIRSSYDFEPQMSETPDFSNLECLESVRSFDASQYSDGHSISSDENPFPLADFEKNFPERMSSSQISVTDHDDAESDLNQEHIKERYDNSLVDLCEEVRNIVSEDVATDRYAGSNMPDLSPNLYTSSNASSPRASSTSCVAKVVNTDRENQNLGSSWLKEDKGLNYFNKVVVPSPDKVSPWLPESSTSSIRSLRLARSRSCKASLMMNASPYWFEKEELTENTPIEKVFTRRPDGSRTNINALNYNFIPDRLSWNGPESSAGCSAIDELEVHNNVKTSIDMESDSNGTLASARNEKADLGSINQLVEHQVHEIGLEPANSFKRLEQMQFDGKTSSDWLSEFKRLQREIIELWHACNVPLVHRTYFFLLFKGDPSDSIYMEVERRRLSFLKQTFSEGNQTLEDGRIITPASSMKHLRRERQMLCRKMQKRLSKAERENLYLKWGIRLSSKNRGLQLAHSLWTQTEDMDHIRESAALVAKLVGPVEPQEAFREMFGLNFAPRRTSSRRSFGWSVTRKNILRG